MIRRQWVTPILAQPTVEDHGLLLQQLEESDQVSPIYYRHGTGGLGRRVTTISLQLT
jgi:hypothetical protein